MLNVFSLVYKFILIFLSLLYVAVDDISVIFLMLWHADYY